MSQRALLLRLRLKRTEKKIDAEVDWNFGYSPNTPYFDKLLESREADQIELSALERDATDGHREP